MNLKTKVIAKLVAGAFAATLSASALAAPVAIVDLFSTNQAQLVDTTTGDGGLSSSVGAGVDATILGGERDLYVELLTQAPSNPFATASIGVGGGAMSFSVDAGATGTGTVQWDGADNSIALDTTGLAGFDLTAGGVGEAFAVTTIFSDLGFEFVIEAYTDADTFTRISLNAHATNSPTTTFIPFSAFAMCGVSGGDVNFIQCGADGAVDFSDLGALQLLIDPNGGTVSVDLTVDQIVVVPEPTTLALLAGGLLLGGFATRRRRT